MIPYLANKLHSHTQQAGVGLVELMVAMVISLFLLAGLFTIFFSTRTTYDDQQALSALQENETLAASILANTIRSAGYFPYGTTYADRNEAFPAAGTTWAQGQVLAANTTTFMLPGNNATTVDTLSVRMIPEAALNCLGQNSTSVQINTFSVLNNAAGSSPYSLACSVQSASGSVTSSAVVSPLGARGVNPNGGGIANMQVMIGVAPNGDYVQQYYTPAQMTAANWQNARTVVVTLTFFNPLFNAAQTPTANNTDANGQPRYLKLTRVVRLENLAQ
ncbi:hypothetical protein BI364_17010 [Acidihalobacter yilgarnensis]|uniref:Pilus assembly protein PilW n=1 Tax=Acidihalobacter yilgarnensis TaxID=2819280 RepID=A0A1D8IS89_9GAMM|nr:prepilin-type N-terminal cleavage/methylation domain-containing protein [Acidihalobacter yilgarnensis]AOU99398.1 hypothetical protein BI364_17010 [Acidihalobacter yilgarnensis]